MSRYVTFDIDDIRGSAFGSALNTWEKVCGGRSAPAWNRDIHFLDFDVRLIPRMMLVQVDGRSGVGVYRFWGTGIKTYDGRDQSNGRVDSQETPEMQEDFVCQYEQVIETRTPRAYATQIRLNDPLQRYKFEACLRLPFSTDGENVDWVLSIDHYADDWDVMLSDLGVAAKPQPSG